jgi:hypothetical protein
LNVLLAGMTRSTNMRMMSDDLTLSAQPTAEEWLGVCEPGLKKATMAMFRACKEIAYKIRTASCDKMACFNEFGKLYYFFNGN